MIRRTRLTISFALAAALVVGGVLAVPTAASAAPTVERISGADRYATAAAVSRAAYPTAGSANTVVLASGEGFADSLSAGSIAAKLGGPLLLTAAASLPSATGTELTRLAPAHVVILGGTSVVSAAVEASIRAIVPDTARIAGADRYATSVAAVRAAFPNGAGQAFVATGSTFPDALTGGALAAVRSAPLVIVPGTAASAPAAVVQLLNDLGVTSVTVLGGTGAVDAAVAAGLGSASRTVQRIGGATRYAVAAAVAAKFPAGSTSVLVANGLNYPDALTATAVAARRAAPLMLSAALCADPTVRSYISAHSTATMTLIGGTGVLRGLVGTLQTCLSTTAPTSTWVMVDKLHALTPMSYAPSDLRRVNLAGGYEMRNEAAGAIERMSAASVSAGAGPLGLSSGYRSYATQTTVYNNYVAQRGRAEADLISARPGFSEHQTGFAADVIACGNGCTSIDDFAYTAQGKWVLANAYRYGFIVRYEPGMTSITGYESEPWHLRYVGVALATDYKTSGFHTLEQYLGYPAAPHY